MQKVAHCGILYGSVVCGLDHQSLTLLGCSGEHGADVETCDSDWKETYGSEH